ncbi:GDSL family lipase [Paenibacillus oryzae]|uniref:GDSL family lipase n=1 Tax=Paenibacillus oryzae TaxID=1844972 RepID=A0A1A5YMH1_9BACL|nr:GDSL-type esterase/lipase family protein [Paenibacillus oryzae]OBR66743.1 GDSL family lipase [Paenibacillus oryzae]
MSQIPGMTTYRLDELENVKVHGRTTKERSPLTLFWTASGIELNVTGSELLLEIETNYSHFEQWIGIWINGAEVSRMMLPKGRQWITVFRGMNPDTLKNVKVIKEVQAMSGDKKSLFQLHAAASNGSFHPVAEAACKLEFIGDSITSGEGIIGARAEMDWLPMWFSAGHGYAKLTADALGADYRVLSQSGWGVLSSWDNNPHSNLPRYYEQICGLLQGKGNKELGALQGHDFTEWQPDVVVINLGTNDQNAFYQPEWRDDETGEAFKQRLLQDGSFHPEDLERFQQAVRQFLVKLRRCNPDAYLLWAYGMLGTSLLSAISKAVDHYVEESGDRRASVFQLPEMNEEGVGARSHPGKLAHAKAAEALAQRIDEILGNNQ